MSMIVTRFAPSPTGALHLGHAYSALFAWNAARDAGGRFLLRIEDIDPNRCRPEYETALKADLAWLGLEWPEPARRQSEHMDDYRAALDRLDGLGVVYPCFCSRQDIQAEMARAVSAPHGPAAHTYPGTCRHLDPALRADRLAAGHPHALRLDAAAARRLTGPLRWHDRALGWQDVRIDLLGDVVLSRRDSPTSYHLSVTVDDALQGVTLVTRGRDLLESTHTHRLLQALLGLPEPDWHHHPLLVNARGERLAKRDMAEGLAAMRAAGRSPVDIRAMIAANAPPDT